MTATLTRPEGELVVLIRDHRKFATAMLVNEVSHRQVAAALGWKSHSYVGRLARGLERTVTPETALRLAKLLRQPFDELFIIKVSSDTGRTGQKKVA